MKTETFDNPILTKAETRLLPYLANGKTPRQISELRFRSLNTIRRQIESAREKLGAHNAAHLVALAIQKGILRLTVWLLILTAVPGFDDDQSARVGRTRLKPTTIRTVRSND